MERLLDPRAQEQAVARVHGRGARRVRAGHPWVFRPDLLEAAAAPGGAVVRVVDETGNPLGRAFQAAGSRIALRMLTRKDEPCDEAFFQGRLERSLAFRRTLWPDADAGRLVHGESDGLPGLFVDRYGDALSLQTTSEGADVLTPLFVRLLVEALAPRVIVAKNDTSARDFEGLQRGQGLLHGGPEATTTYHEGPNRFALDLLADLKTGAFLDQRENHVHAAGYMPEGGTGLDTFSYHGGFALSLATRASSVIAVEADEQAAARIGVNARANGRPVEAICGNSFDVLRQFEREGRRFDVVVIDPPAFTKRKGDVQAAERAYKELNLRGLKLVKQGGVLISCSCSGKMTPARFGAILDAAIADAKRPVQQIERRGAARDHPVLVGVPETEYLKCWVYRVL
ncbi:class I SAM-dependent rRNA methyltransferase [Vulgatibacter sp.]|uniref:class I SAM-dependent rRNA methyltransferase n=1 Tax=Vulgatibacter sp. TaxID=1971226 RepID=UPI003568D2D2